MFGSLSTKIAHSTITPALGNQDLRFLQESINKEKELVTSVQKLSKDFGTAAEALKQWAAGEGEDLSDVASGSMIISTHIISALNTFAEHESNIRSQLKDVRTKEEQLDELRRRRKAVASKLEAQERRLSKMGSEVGFFPLIIGELGKLLAAEVPQDVTPPGQGRAPYPGREAVVQITAEAARCVAGVTFNGAADTDFASRQARPRPQALALAPPAEGGIPPNGMMTHDHDHSRFTETSSLGGHPPYTPSSVHGGTMPPSREYSTMSAGPPPVDEFGRPIDGLPMSANTMPALGAKQQQPIQQMPLSAIQHSMRTPHSPGGPDTFVPSHNPTGSSSGSRGGSSRPVFHAPPPPPTLNLPHQQQQHHAQDPRGAPPGHGPNQDLSGSRFNQYPPAQGRQGATVERGLTLSLPLSSRRSPSPAIDQAENDAPEEKEVDSPFVPPAGNAPSSFKPPQQPTRQGTQDSGDVVLGSGEADLQRTTTLPPKLGFGGDFPEWSLGFEELGLGADLEGKKDTPALEKEAEPKVEKKGLPEPPSAAPAEPEDRSPISAVPKSLREPEGGSQASTPITQTPTTYSNTQTPTTQTPTTYTPTSTGPDGLKIVHDHVVDNPNTRTSGNSGRFAMFPDKRKPTPQSSLDRADSTNNNSSLMPPHTKTSTTHPGAVDRTPSPYPEGVSPVPTPAEEKQSEDLPLDIAALITHPEFEEPGGLLAPAPKKSILVDPQHSRTDTMGTFGAGPNSAASHDGPRLRFAPRPPSPITPSPVTPGNPAWASMDSLDRSGVGPIGSSSELARAPAPVATEVSSTPGYMEAGSGRSEQGSKGDNRLSIITPLEVHKKEGGSHPSTRE
ncbi:hypothetical protein M408DRAFT_81178 [Serendipita vermifera MAFF 305830]|uniref:Uncharacterized protein n=1 Tax=Serendipita vermifera MAFF 305830 TaxID=933852 RepID=A0A0C3A8N4_SERVB|nr:hypothetical protein M408DRAFT_81178 [Serendipita vermifera MAFF 305830]